MMSKVRKAVIAAAGRGTRQFPASKAVQKTMFPLVDRDGLTKPVIQLIAQEAIESGIEEICIIVRPGEQALYQNYFRPLDPESIASFEGKPWAIDAATTLADIGRRLSFAEQKTPEGFGHAVFQAKSFVRDDPFLLLLGDHVYLSDIPRRCARQIIDAFELEPLDAVTGAQLTCEDQLHQFGTIRGTPVDPQNGIYHAELIIEKPSVETARRELATPGISAGKYLSHFGMHVFSPRIFDSIEYLMRHNLRGNGEIELTTAQEHLRRQTGRYHAAIVFGRRFDTGNPLGLIETQLALALAGVHPERILDLLEKL